MIYGLGLEIELKITAHENDSMSKYLFLYLDNLVLDCFSMVEHFAKRLYIFICFWRSLLISLSTHFIRVTSNNLIINGKLSVLVFVFVGEILDLRKYGL